MLKVIYSYILQVIGNQIKMLPKKEKGGGRVGGGWVEKKRKDLLTPICL